MVTFTIDMDQLRTIADAVVRRATIFMGIGVNAARIDPPVSHVLDDRVSFSVTPAELSPQQKRHFVDEFETWVIANGFRDLVETFDVFLGEAYGAILLMGPEAPDVQTWQKKCLAFSRGGGLSQHMAQVCEGLGVENRFAQMFESVQAARNCMAHRRGVVSVQDLGKHADSSFRLVWRTRSIFLAVDGVDISLALQAGNPIFIEQGQPVESREVERYKEFFIGQSIKLHRHELSEICLAFTIATDFIVHSIIEHAQNRGILALKND